MVTGDHVVRGAQSHGPFKSRVSPHGGGKGVGGDLCSVVLQRGGACAMEGGLQGRKETQQKRGLDPTAPRTRFGPESPDKPGLADV